MIVTLGIYLYLNDSRKSIASRTAQVLPECPLAEVRTMARENYDRFLAENPEMKSISGRLEPYFVIKG